jgi:hypothetical protein
MCIVTSFVAGIRLHLKKQQEKYSRLEKKTQKREEY